MYKCQFIFVLITEIVLLALYASVVEYGPEAANNSPHSNANFLNKYPMFQDIQVMIFVGFGFLMVFLRHHSWTSVTFNFFVSAFVIQLNLVFDGFWVNVIKHTSNWKKIQLSIESLILADFAAGAVLISFGAVLGKVNSFQLLVMALFEVFFYNMNSVIGFFQIETSDIGGSIFIHTFGAYFGLAVSAVLTHHNAKNNPQNQSSNVSNLVAMVGTLFLWMFWPSFNGALATDNAQHRALLNTVISIASSCVAAFLISSLTHKGKYEMEDILNATLAGGVIIGSVADIAVSPVWPLLIGFIGGIVSAFGFYKINPALTKRLGLHDTCGVHYLHGIPGVIAGIISAIFAGVADEVYSSELNTVYPGRAKRSAAQQSAVQIGALIMTLGVAIASGVVTGFILKCKCFKGPQEPEDFYSDKFNFAGIELEKYKHMRGEQQSISMMNPPDVSKMGFEEKPKMDFEEKTK